MKAMSCPCLWISPKCHIMGPKAQQTLVPFPCPASQLSDYVRLSHVNMAWKALLVFFTGSSLSFFLPVLKYSPSMKSPSISQKEPSFSLSCPFFWGLSVGFLALTIVICFLSCVPSLTDTDLLQTRPVAWHP